MNALAHDIIVAAVLVSCMCIVLADWRKSVDKALRGRRISKAWRNAPKETK